MKLNQPTVTAVISAALLTGSAAFGQSGDAILDLLTKKGVISQREANDAREQLDKQNAETVAVYDKVKVSSWVNALNLYGDGRLRYEWRSGAGNATGAGAVSNTDEDRFRYRLRAGVKGDFLDSFSYGLRLETATKGNSANTTMGGNGAAVAGGPWGKGGTDAIGVGQLWAQYKYSDWLVLTGGKMENPFMTTRMVWDDDLNPEGFSEKLKYSLDKADLFLTLGEFTYSNTGVNNPFGGTHGTGGDTWLLGAQAGGKVKFTKDLSLTLAPTLYMYANTRPLGANFAPKLGATGNNITGIDDLTVVDVPVEFAFPVGKIPGKLFGDFAINTSAKDRATLAKLAAYKNQDTAYQAGLAVGSTKKKHDWQVKAYWQHSEMFALDPNLVDSDLFDSRLNMQGYVVNGQYLFTDFLSLGVTYANSWVINHGINTSLFGAGDLGGNLRSYDLVQADLNWKF